LGKKLLKKAEQIVKKNNIKKLKIISGVGVREYYKKLGYKLDKQGYMEKEL
jgi:elongator complex protein 3